MRQARLLVASALCFALLCALALAATRRHVQKPLMLHPKFHRLPDGDTFNRVVAHGGRYVVLLDGAGHSTVLDGHTGRIMVLREPSGSDCQPFQVGGPWILARCHNPAPEPPPWYELYDPALNVWDNNLACDQDECLAADAIGRYWIHSALHCGPAGGAVGDPHVWSCAGDNYVNINTSQVQSAPTSRRYYGDVNSPGLVRKVCSPLRVPTTIVDLNSEGGDTASFPGTLTFYGHGYAVASWSDHDTGPHYQLERCGTHLHQQLNAVAPVGNSKVILWQPLIGCCTVSSTEIDGVLTATGRRIRLLVPTAAQNLGPLAVSDRNVYLGPWVASLPAAAR